MKLRFRSILFKKIETGKPFKRWVRRVHSSRRPHLEDEEERAGADELGVEHPRDEGSTAGAERSLADVLVRKQRPAGRRRLDDRAVVGGCGSFIIRHRPGQRR